VKKNTAEENKVVLSELVATYHGVAHHHSYASEDCIKQIIIKTVSRLIDCFKHVMWTNQSNELHSLVFVQKFKCILMKMNKNCCHRSCSFWLRYAPNRLLAGALPQTPLGELTALPHTP